MGEASDGLPLPVPDIETRLAQLERASYSMAAWLVQLSVFGPNDADAIKRMLTGLEDLDGTPGTSYEPRV
jgi:hypothetical protein